MEKFFGKKKEQLSQNIIGEVRNWYADRYHHAILQRNILIIIALTSIFGIIFLVLSSLEVARSKTIEPFVIEIEKKSGILSVVDPKMMNELNRFQDDDIQAVKRSFLMQYINARESYNPSLITHNYFKLVKLFSSQKEWSKFVRYINMNNPDSPLVKYGNGQESIRNVRLRSIVFTSDDKTQGNGTAQVRFTVTTEYTGEQVNKIAVVEFNFSTLALSQEDRLINPLGFKVLNYKVDNELL